ncbi:hypothetical protein D7S89_15290 [Trinickia fusca]|uniref:Uncharacterized protein n=1 Tax=Trinickia fusca TaxID=2419777 RepID=A0A494XAK2_9BURK|nr:hypothetical protein D7S89_15290 [Trinickia fusca]
MTGVLTIADGGCLTLTNSTLVFSPAAEDTGSFVIQGNGCLNVANSTLKSGDDKQWNLTVKNTGSVSFTQSSLATNQSGMRFYDNSKLIADNSDVEEVQVHDSASLTLQNNASAYIVAFFTGSGSASFPNGEFNAGNGVTRTISIPTGDTTTGSISLSNANINGFQLDLQDTYNLSIANANGVVLSLHLTDYVNNNFTSNITSTAPTSGTVDFSASSNPKFTWNNAQISMLNLYLDGASNLTWNGTTTMNEVNTLGSSSLTLNSNVSLWANLAQSYESSKMTLNSVTLLEDDSTHPSFTATDNSVITANNTVAPARTALYQTAPGQILINGGSGWPSVQQQ